MTTRRTRTPTPTAAGAGEGEGEGAGEGPGEGAGDGGGDGRRARWVAHRTARRKELIAATVAVVRSEGSGVSMDDIASSSGIAKPVYYRYFADKADLHLAVGRAVAENVVRQVTAALDQGDSVRARLGTAIDAYLRSIESDPELYQFVVHGAPRRRSTSDPVEDYATVVGEHAARTLGALLRQAGADAGAAETWGFGLVGMVRAAADRWLERPTMSRGALVEYLTDLVVPGLVAVLPDATAAPERLATVRPIGRRQPG